MKEFVVEWIIDSWKREWNSRGKNEWKLSLEENKLYKLGIVL